MSSAIRGVHADDVERLFASQIAHFTPLLPDQLSQIYVSWVSTAARTVPNTPTHSLSVLLLQWLHERIMILADTPST